MWFISGFVALAIDNSLLPHFKVPVAVDSIVSTVHVIL